MVLSILKTFIHDPLVEWNRGRSRNESKETVITYCCSPKFNVLADSLKQTTSIKNIEDRLLGNFPKAKGLPLSIEGQVHSLIQVNTTYNIASYILTITYSVSQEATDIDNLCRMFIGWAAYM